MKTCSEAVLDVARNQFSQDGYCTFPSLIPSGLIDQLPLRIQSVMNGEYKTAIEPIWVTANDPDKLRIIDQSHASDPTIYELVSHPIIGQAVAAVTGARKVQLWAASLIYKPPGGNKTGAVGWHQDFEYFDSMFEVGPEEIITAWIAISNVTTDAGPVTFVPGSHCWGLLKKGDLFNPDHQVSVPEGRTWSEVPAILSPGAFSLHHSLIFHGSGANCSNAPRVGFALHLCTEKAISRPITPNNPGYEYLRHLDDATFCPILYNEPLLSG